jgi:hypothetical protein
MPVILILGLKMPLAGMIIEYIVKTALFQPVALEPLKIMKKRAWWALWATYQVPKP